jgi:hypothetical protein
MPSYVSADLRRMVMARSKRRCEYCLIHEDDTYLGCQVDHVIAEKHGGPTHIDNLSYACTFCNRAKGTDLGSIASGTGELVRFFNPRTDQWTEHFRLNGVQIEPLTVVGEVTARILGFNTSDRLLERDALRLVGRYPVVD